MRVRFQPPERHWFDSSPASSCLLSGNGKHASLVRRRSGFDSPGRLHADVAQPIVHDAPNVGVAGSQSAVRSM